VATLINDTYFVGERNIPNTTNSSVLERLTFFITKYEEELLQAVLGYALYKAYKAGIAATTPDSKWTELQDGKEYTDSNNRLRKWNGFRDADSKRSMIANYVYFWWMRDKASISTSIGEVQEKPDNSASISSLTKQSRAWNEMVSWIEEMILFLDTNIETYPEWEQANVWKIRNDFRPINIFNL
jgi:hypothetical protein